MHLGALPGGYNSFANSIDPKGAIVGTAETADMDPVLGTVACHPPLWRDGAVIDLGTLGGYEGRALQSNGRGQVVDVATNGAPDSFLGCTVTVSHNYSITERSKQRFCGRTA
jgi:probable HAF family extracellular repeat protein